MTFYILKAFLFPPGMQFVMFVFAFLIRVKYRWLSRFCVFLAVISLWCLSTPAIKNFLLVYLDTPYAAQAPQQKPDDIEAIVILGAGQRKNALEYGGNTVSDHGLERLRYGAYLAKRWGVPVILSGGIVYETESVSEAAVGAKFLREELGITDIIEEGRSRNTWENAQFTAELLKEKGIEKIALVTHGYHMRRSVYAFSQAGVDHTPYLTVEISISSCEIWWVCWLPSAGTLYSSRRTLHEYIGLLAYRMK